MSGLPMLFSAKWMTKNTTKENTGAASESTPVQSSYSFCSHVEGVHLSAVV